MRKIATCCYCGTRAALVMRAEGRHELSCAACGAPLHEMKMLPCAKLAAAPARPERPAAKPARAQKPAYRPSPKRPVKRRKPRKKLFKKVFEEIWDVVEDIFD